MFSRAHIFAGGACGEIIESVVVEVSGGQADTEVVVRLGELGER